MSDRIGPVPEEILREIKAESTVSLHRMLQNNASLAREVRQQRDALTEVLGMCDKMGEAIESELLVRDTDGFDNIVNLLDRLQKGDTDEP